MKVYVVETGYKYEGGSAKAVFQNYNDAKGYVAKLKQDEVKSGYLSPYQYFDVKEFKLQ